LKRRGNSSRGEITGEKLVILRKADAIYLEEIRDAAL
jgi:GMP synthase PP-ATPase subunit